MSDNIPFEMQIEILKWFPVNSLIRFRSVSKSWKSSIDSSKFINDYTLRHSQSHQHLFLRYYVDFYENKHYVTIIDNDDFSFPEPNIISPPAPLTVNIHFESSVVVGSSHGLLGLFVFYQQKGLKFFKSMAVIWNPSIRKSVAIDTLDVITKPLVYVPAVGFGVCPVTYDAKVVKINNVCLSKEMESLVSNAWHVEVFTLRSGVWRSKVELNHVPSNSIEFICSDYVVVVERFIYWIAAGDGISMILSFDLTSEEFKKIDLPDKVAAQSVRDLFIFKQSESLVVVECKETSQEQGYTIWMMMENGFSKSFRMLFIVSLPYDRFRRIVGFRKNGELIMETINDDDEDDAYDDDDDVVDDGDDDDDDDVVVDDDDDVDDNEDVVDDDDDDDDEDDDNDDDEKRVVLVAYEPCSKRIKNLGIYGECGSFMMSSYKESLLLLNQPNTIMGYRHDVARCEH